MPKKSGLHIVGWELKDIRGTGNVPLCAYRSKVHPEALLCTLVPKNQSPAPFHPSSGALQNALVLCAEPRSPLNNNFHFIFHFLFGRPSLA